MEDTDWVRRLVGCNVLLSIGTSSCSITPVVVGPSIFKVRWLSMSIERRIANGISRKGYKALAFDM